MSTLLRDVIDIPERTGAEDYVLRLTDGIDDAHIAQTLDEYVVTPALVGAFDLALDVVVGALRDRTSRGAFLAGSFGSGKSHFMAVLHALLRQQPQARAIGELQTTVAAHDPELQGRKILPLAYHLLGARTLEEALLGGYVRQIHALHPGAPLPAVHEDQAILADGDNQRETLGDDRFFEILNAGASDDAWASVLGAGSWDRSRYDEARAAAPGNPARQQLVTVLVERFFSAYTNQADYLDLDRGLAAVAAHAQSLGYDAVVLFLDELVLWLAFGVQDREFFRREAQKLTKLVESSIPRAIPLVSFVARQLDLRRWFADAGASGAEQEALDRAFRHQEGRFTTITLGDDNLPFVAHQRLLRPHDKDAEALLSQAFDRLERRPDVWDVLLDGIFTDEQHRGADESAFRLTYPFSPALVSTLRSLAGYMQRERTALKVMGQMLVDRRDDLTVDDLIPVGEAFDYVVSGKQALDESVTARFRAATALWNDKLQPLIARKRGVVAGQALPPGYVSDERLAKTLLLSAIAPDVPALKELTAGRIASLNHGSISSPLAGREAATALGTIREWSSSVPEISVGDDPRNPVIRVRLADVDYESIVENVRGEDNDGRRRELIRELVRSALGVVESEQDVFGAIRHQLVWRGSRREVDLVFGNVRDASWLSPDHFVARPGTWRFVIDHPFDEAGHSAAEDVTRIDQLQSDGLSSSTVIWLPRFLAPERMQELSRLVKLDWVLSGTGERWTTASQHLSETDRAVARSILETQRSSLEERLRSALQQAYGAAAITANTLVDDPGHERVLFSLDRAFDPARPVGADLRAAFDDVVDRAMSCSAPGHPRFEPSDQEVSIKELATTVSYVDRALGDPEARVLIEPGDRPAVRRVANTIGVGRAGETHFTIGDDTFVPWGAEFERAQARAGLDSGAVVAVGQVREWIRAMTPRLGLRTEVEDVIILAWAALRQRSLYQAGAPVGSARPGQLQDSLELRPEPLPSVEDFQAANSRAQAVFGIVGMTHLTASTLSRFCELVRTEAQSTLAAARQLVEALEVAYQQAGISQQTGRLTTARAAAALVGELLSTSDRVAFVRRLAQADATVTDVVVARSLRSAPAVSSAVASMHWDRFAPLRSAAAEKTPRGQQAAMILAELQTAVRTDEFDAPLAVALARADDALFHWLADGTPPPPVPPPPPGGSTGRGSAHHRPGAEPSVVLDQLGDDLAAHPDATFDISWTWSQE